jgi:hypothetical protein
VLEAVGDGVLVVFALSHSSRMRESRNTS